MKFKFAILALSLFILLEQVNLNQQITDEGTEEAPAEQTEEGEANQVEGEGEEGEGKEEEENEQVEDPKKVKKSGEQLSCNQEIVTTFGMEGVEEPITDPIEMCPQIEQSCCQVKDQLTIYERFVQGAEEEGLKERFGYYKSIYEDMLDKVLEVHSKSVNLLTLKENDEPDNCKLIVTRLNQFNLGDVIPQLKVALKRMEEFYQTSYKGVYCSICDAKNHKFFDVTAKKIFFSQKFCREIVDHSIHSLLYFNHHLPSVMNLVSRFVVSCNSKGEFAEKTIDAKYIFANKGAGDLQKCLDGRNETDWFVNCSHICENFGLMKFQEFFVPNIEPFTNYTLFLADSLKKLDAESQESNEMHENSERILSEDNAEPKEENEQENQTEGEGENKEGEQTEVVEEVEVLDPAKRFKNPIIIKSNLNAVIPIDEFKSEFTDPGKFANIDVSIYEKVKNMSKQLEEAEAAAMQAQGEGDAEGADSDSNAWKLLLSKTMLMISFVYLFNQT